MNDSKTVGTTAKVAHERQTSPTISHMKAMQCSKIRELRQALVRAGVLTLDQQAKSLGVSRSTAWAVLKGNHKSSGLSATLINRMLASPQLPGSARKIILEYVKEKSAGAYGHGKERLRQFRARLANGQSFDAAESRVAD
jgi:DNA-binding transcriptional regulator YiaG